MSLSPTSQRTKKKKKKKKRYIDPATGGWPRSTPSGLGVAEIHPNGQGERNLATTVAIMVSPANKKNFDEPKKSFLMPQKSILMPPIRF
jgi:hypothetical protein